MIKITSEMSWQDIATTAQAYRDSTIAAVEPKVPEIPTEIALNVTDLPAKLLPAEVVELTELPTESLLHRMATGSLKSTQVTKAFLQRAGLAGKLVNCITELLPERALERATELDDHYATHGKPVGPLHGLPISVKEHIAMKGLDLNAGFISWVGRVAPDDGLILKLLWNAGCVFYARTTEPQTLMHLETSSNIYGVTVNPYNTGLTSGGSSGGEGALLGMRGSCLGIGTDIGGSIRSPAANQGLFGLKPTSYRLPLDGFAATMNGQEQIVPTIGPLSTSLEGVKIFMKTLIGQKPWLYEPSLVPMPWRESEKQGSLVSLTPFALSYMVDTDNISAPQRSQWQVPPHRRNARRRHRQAPSSYSPRHGDSDFQTRRQPQHKHRSLPTSQTRRRLAYHQQPLLLRRRCRRESCH